MESINSCVDGGYGWIIVISAGTIHGLSLAVLTCTGQIFAAVLETRSFSRSQVASFIALPSILTFVLAIFANKLAELYSFKVTFLLGTFLTAFGMCLSSLATYNLAFFTFSFIVVGVGLALAIFPCHIIIGFYFKQKRALAMAVMSALTAINLSSMPLVVQYLLDEYSLGGTLLLWGGILLHGCVAAMFIREPYWALKRLTKTRNKDENETFLEHQNAHDPTRTARAYAMLKMIFVKLVQDGRHFSNLVFILLLLGRIAFFYRLVSVGLVLPKFAMEEIEGLTAKQAAFLVSLFSLADVVSKLSVNWINKIFSNQTVVYLIALFGAAIFLVPFVYVDSYPAIFAACVIYGLFNGYIHVQYYLVMFNTFGLADAPGAIALHCMIKGFCLLSTGPIMAWIRNLTGSYKHCFTLNAVFLASSCFLWACYGVILHCRKKKSITIYMKNLDIATENLK